MAFHEQDYRQAAVIYDNLNSTACFYTAALRVLSKADWSTHAEFEDHIVHQAMKAVAQGWTAAINLRNYNFGPFHLALAVCTLPKQVHGEVQRLHGCQPPRALFAENLLIGGWRRQRGICPSARVGSAAQPEPP